ncbi:ABC transporter permease [Streptococcus sp. DD12]|uniref:ABC transporter permease n=1 Tax=Streptococcus sp. DD12 TaxID=1777880 RepID=UPI0007991D69|nr:ABC transporter permease [Streptococcus sp. DD12]KXT76585.1 ABC transporter permease protein [Streptococcus sp. DD12]
MSKRIYWKDIRQSFTGSWGRFLSIFFLMFLGSLTLVGLKATTPNMQRTGQAYIDQTHTMDLAVMSTYGLSEDDVKELKSIKGAQVEFGYVTDETIAKSGKAIRLFSQPDKISKMPLTAGRLPKKADEIALGEQFKGRYQIGDKISLNAKDKSSTLKAQTFTVTGFVKSSEIWGKTNMGATTAGDGELSGYAMVAKRAFKSSVYSIARLSYDDLRGVGYYSTTYSQRLAKHQKALNRLIADNASQRLAQIKAQGQDKINQGYTAIAQSEQELATAEEAIANGQATITSKQTTLDQASAELAQKATGLQAADGQLAQSQAQLAQANAQLTTAGGALSQAQAQLDAKKTELDQAGAQLEQAQAQLTATKTQLDEAKGKIDAGKTALADSKSQLDALAQTIAQKESELASAQTALQTDKDNLTAQGQDPASDSGIQAREAELASQTQTLEGLKATYTSQETTYNQAVATLTQEEATYQSGLTQYQTALAEFEANQTAYQNGLAQYQAGLATYTSQLASYENGQAQYQSGLETYASANNQYTQGLAQFQAAQSAIATNQAKIDAAIQNLATAKSAYAQKKAQADQEIAQAKANLLEAQKQLNQLPLPIYTSYTRSTLPGGDGYEMYKSSTNSISGVGNLFPVVLYIVAAMVTFTTMTRFVDEERNKAGIFKALGYTNRQIIAKFVLYGLVASLLGTIAGSLTGTYPLAYQLSRIVGTSTLIGTSQLYFYPGLFTVTMVLALLAAVLPAYWVARQELIEKPAQLLLPKPPVSGAKILLERLTFIWRRMSFTHKVTARNIFRYKQRMAMTVFGVAGSVALLFAGLGIRSSISGIAESQFQDILTYQMVLTTNQEASQSEKDDLLKALNDKKKVTSYQEITYQSTQQTVKNATEEQPVSVIVANARHLSSYVKMTSRATGKPIQLTNQGVVLSEKLAQLYGVKAGDQITVSLQEKKYRVKVAAVTEMYAGHFIFMTPSYYQKVTGQKASENAYFVRSSDSSTSQVKTLASQLLKMNAVSTAVLNTSLINQISSISHSMENVMVILIVLATLLGVVILYNLTNINVAERIRELSTIKVLGFHNREVTLYIYRETIVLSLAGIVTGLGMGVLLHRAILAMIGSSTMMFNPDVALSVWVIPILVIILILAVLGWYVNHQLRQVDMLEALKSVD